MSISTTDSGVALSSVYRSPHPGGWGADRNDDRSPGLIRSPNAERGSRPGILIYVPPIAFLECSRCHQQVSAATPQTVCPSCAGPLYVRYSPEALKAARKPGPDAPPSMWRYASVLPETEPVTLGEGWTPMLPSRRYPGLLVKEEADNPTGSFKARGMSAGCQHGSPLRIEETSGAFSRKRRRRPRRVCRSRGHRSAHLHAARRTDGQLPRRPWPTEPTSRWSTGSSPTAAGWLPSAKREGWFDVSTLKEPFRVEGKKTMGYELVEQLGWTYPTLSSIPPAAASA